MENDPHGFDSYSSVYEDVLDHSLKRIGGDGWYYAKQKIDAIGVFYRKTGIREPSRIIEIGCGTGKNLVLLRRLFPTAELFGVDVSGKSIEEAQKNRISNCNIEKYDGTKLPYRSHEFDLLLAVNVFHHVDRRLHVDLAKMINEAMKVGGHFVLFEHNPLNPITRRIVKDCIFDQGVSLLTHWYSQKMVIKAGMKVDSTRFITFFPPKMKKLRILEDYVYRLPLGAQYGLFCTRRMN